MAKALCDSNAREALSARRLGKVRGALEVGVVGTPRELWARLNDDAGMPAAQLMSLARCREGPLAPTGERARDILRLLKPGLMEQLQIDDPATSGFARETIAERSARQKMIGKIQRLYRLTRGVVKLAPADPFETFSKPTASSGPKSSAMAGLQSFSAALRAAKLAETNSKWASAWGAKGMAAAASAANAKAVGADALTRLRDAAQQEMAKNDAPPPISPRLQESLAPKSARQSSGQKMRERAKVLLAGEAAGGSLSRGEAQQAANTKLLAGGAGSLAFAAAVHDRTPHPPATARAESASSGIRARSLSQAVVNSPAGGPPSAARPSGSPPSAARALSARPSQGAFSMPPAATEGGGKPLSLARQAQMNLQKQDLSVSGKGDTPDLRLQG